MGYGADAKGQTRWRGTGETQLVAEGVGWEAAQDFSTRGVRAAQTSTLTLCPQRPWWWSNLFCPPGAVAEAQRETAHPPEALGRPGPVLEVHRTTVWS